MLYQLVKAVFKHNINIYFINCSMCPLVPKSSCSKFSLQNWVAGQFNGPLPLFALAFISGLAFKPI